MNTNEIRTLLSKFQKEMNNARLEFFCVASMPGTKDGASIYNDRGNSSGAAKNARDAHILWEEKNKIDSKHDWSKEKPEYSKW